MLGSWSRVAWGAILVTGNIENPIVRKGPIKCTLKFLLLLAIVSYWCDALILDYYMNDSPSPSTYCLPMEIWGFDLTEQIRTLQPLARLPPSIITCTSGADVLLGYCHFIPLALVSLWQFLTTRDVFLHHKITIFYQIGCAQIRLSLQF